VSVTVPWDLVVLVPGKDEEQALTGLLTSRTGSLSIRQPAFRILRHPRRDNGCYREADQVLQPLQAQARHALVVFDHEGSGQEGVAPHDLAAEVKGRLTRSGWGDRCEAVVIVPELEAWVWSESPHLGKTLGWSGRKPNLREWLRERGSWPAGKAKPPRPKEAVEAATRAVRLPRSSAIYRQLAENVSIERCQDASFLQLVAILRRWFPL